MTTEVLEKVSKAEPLKCDKSILEKLYKGEKGPITDLKWNVGYAVESIRNWRPEIDELIDKIKNGKENHRTKIGYLIKLVDINMIIYNVFYQVARDEMIPLYLRNEIDSLTFLDDSSLFISHSLDSFINGNNHGLHVRDFSGINSRAFADEKMRIVLGRDEEKRSKRKRSLTEEERYDNGNLDEYLELISGCIESLRGYRSRLVREKLPIIDNHPVNYI